MLSPRTDPTVREKTTSREWRCLAIALLVALAATILPSPRPTVAASGVELQRDGNAVLQKLYAQTPKAKEIAAEAKGFWPVYDGYQADLKNINERFARLILRYADPYKNNTLTDDAAKDLFDELFAIEQAEVTVKQGYVPKLSAVLPATKVARHVQIENKIRAVIKYELADAIPLAR
jgi:hypothetical protein